MMGRINLVLQVDEGEGGFMPGDVGLFLPIDVVYPVFVNHPVALVGVGGGDNGPGRLGFFHLSNLP